eukprot:SAG22_NODE_287_length_12963_cov_21.279086_3_plen_141_part_00
MALYYGYLFTDGNLAWLHPERPEYPGNFFRKFEQQGLKGLGNMGAKKEEPVDGHQYADYEKRLLAAFVSALLPPSCSDRRASGAGATCHGEYLQNAAEVPTGRDAVRTMAAGGALTLIPRGNTLRAHPAFAAAPAGVADG